MTTTEDGTFSVQPLPPGLYRISVSATGFSEAAVEDVRVQITETATVNPVLSVAGAELLVFDQCGHVPQVEKATDFNPAVLKFLAATAK